MILEIERNVRITFFHDSQDLFCVSVLMRGAELRACQRLRRRGRGHHTLMASVVTYSKLAANRFQQLTRHCSLVRVLGQISYLRPTVVPRKDDDLVECHCGIGLRSDTAACNDWAGGGLGVHRAFIDLFDSFSRQWGKKGVRRGSSPIAEEHQHHYIHSIRFPDMKTMFEAAC